MNGRTNSTKEGDTIINGALIPLESPTNLEFVPRNQAVRITWEDPLDKYTTPGDDLVTAWDHTLLIRKEGSAPSSPTDGIEVLKETTRNQYIENYYTDENLTNGITYHYALYAYGTNNTISNPTISSVEARTGVPVYYRQLSGLSANLSETATATVADKYIFAGGHINVATVGESIVNIFDGNLTRSTSNLNDPARAMAGVSLTNYGVFGSGYRTSNNDNYYMYAFNELGVCNQLSSFEGPYGSGTTGVSIGSHGFFEGNNDDLGTAISNDLVITAIDGIYSTHDSIREPAGSSIGGYAIFAGGYNSGFGSELAWPKKAIAYDNSLTRRSITQLTYNIVYPVGAQNSNYALISGSLYGKHQRISEAYDQNLTKVATSSIISPPAYVEDLMYSAFTGVHLGTYCVFSWSGQSNSAYNTNLVMYDEDLTYIYKDDIIPTTTDKVWCSVAKDPYGLFLSASNELHVLTT